MSPLPPTTTFPFYPDAITHGERTIAAHPGTGYMVETRSFGPDLNTVHFYAVRQPQPVFMCPTCHGRMVRGWCEGCSAGFMRETDADVRVAA